MKNTDWNEVMWSFVVVVLILVIGSLFGYMRYTNYKMPDESMCRYACGEGKVRSVGVGSCICKE